MSKASTKHKKTIAKNAERDKFIANPQSYGEIWSYTDREKGKKEEKKNLLKLKNDETFVPVWGRIITKTKNGKIVSVKVKPELEPGMCISQYGTLISFNATTSGKITAKWLEGSPVETNKPAKETHLKASGRLLHRAEWFSFTYDAIINNKSVKPLTHNGGTEWTGKQDGDIATLKKYFTVNLDNGKKKKYVVHHLDTDAQHNEITNLMLMPDSMHNYMKAHRPGKVKKEAIFRKPKITTGFPWLDDFLNGDLLFTAYSDLGWESAIATIQYLQRTYRANQYRNIEFHHGMIYNNTSITPLNEKTQEIFNGLKSEQYKELGTAAYFGYQQNGKDNKPIQCNINDFGQYNIEPFIVPIK